MGGIERVEKYDNKEEVTGIIILASTFISMFIIGYFMVM